MVCFYLKYALYHFLINCTIIPLILYELCNESAMNNLKFILKQVLIAFLVIVLLLLPWFISKDSLTSFYLFYTIAIVVLFVNIVNSSSKVIPVVLFLAGTFLAVAWIRKIKEVHIQHEKTMKQFEEKFKQH